MKRRRQPSVTMNNIGADITAVVTTFLTNQDVLALVKCSSTYKHRFFMASAPIFTWDMQKLPLVISTDFFHRVKHLRSSSTPIGFPRKLIRLSIDNLVKGDCLPDSLLELFAGQIVDFPKMPSGLVKLTFCSYNKPLPNFPSSLTSLGLGYNFNRPLKIGHFPEGLQHLVFGALFNQKLQEGVLPPTLKSLVFGLEFEQELQPGVLPIGLTDLSFGDFFNLPIQTKVLPTGLKRLQFGKAFNKELQEGILPPTLISLVFGLEFEQKLQPGVLPMGLTNLSFGDLFNLPIQPKVLPMGLKRLQFGKAFNRRLPAEVLPMGLLKVKFGSNFDHPEVVFPSTLQKIVFGDKFDCSVYGPLSGPFGDDINRYLQEKVLPSKLTSLTFGRDFNRWLYEGVLPVSLINLKFGRNYNQPLCEGVLPSKLVSLELGLMFNQLCCIFPPSLSMIVFRNPLQYPLAIDAISYKIMEDVRDMRISTQALPQPFVERFQALVGGHVDQWYLYRRRMFGGDTQTVFIAEKKR